MALTWNYPVVSLEETRARFRAFGLLERASGESFLYRPSEAPGRMLLILTPQGLGAQIYLFPEALARAPGAAQPFYAALEAAGFGMGSKLGPSIGLDITNQARMAIFWEEFGRLMRGEA
jgi:hypothetical protein